MTEVYTITMGDLREQIKRSAEKHLSEKTLLRVPATEPVNGNAAIPAEMPIEEPSVPMDNDENSNEAIDARVSKPKFDAGVESNPETDPKTYLQQLVGKLSTEFQKYAKDVPNDANEMAKYIMGMIASQAGKYMDDSNRNSIIKKLNTAKNNQDAEEEEASEAHEQANVVDNMPESLVRETISDAMNDNEKVRNDRVNRAATTRQNRPYKPKF